MIVVVIGVAVVLVHEVLAEHVVGERVGRLLVVVVGHASLVPAAAVGRARRVMARPIWRGQKARAAGRDGQATRGPGLPRARASLTAPGRPATLRR
jgi:hypothetical protein